MDSDHFSNIFGTFHVVKKFGTFQPLFIADIFQKMQEQHQLIFKKYYFAYLKIPNFQKMKMLKKTGTEHDEDPSKKFFKILDMGPTSTREHE